MPKIWPIFSKSKTNQKVSLSETICEATKGSHEYKIKGYSLAKGKGVGKYMTSSRFTVGGHDWVILFNPDGNTQDSQEYISVFLEVVSWRKVRATLEFKLLDQSEEGKYGVPRTVTTPIKFSRVGNICWWGFPKYMKRSEFEASSYLKDDCLIIHCTVGVVHTRDKTVQTHVETEQTRIEDGKRYVIPPSNMVQNLKSLLESEIGSDITFHVGNEYFRAHKLILAARSPVFKAQFFGLVGNPDIETVAIKEFEPFAFKAMLLYLYTDALPEACELSDSDSPCTSTSIMQHLLDAADRFDLPQLKLMCEEKLCEQLTSDTVATTLALADEHQCLQLKTFCLNFAAKPENLGEVMKSDGYAYLEKSYPELLTELLKTSAVLDKK